MCGGSSLPSRRAVYTEGRDEPVAVPVDQTQEVEVSKVKEQQAKPGLFASLFAAVFGK